MSGNELLEFLLIISERVANVIRLCRTELYLRNIMDQERRHLNEMYGVPEELDDLEPVKWEQFTYPTHLPDPAQQQLPLHVRKRMKDGQRDLVTFRSCIKKVVPSVLDSNFEKFISILIQQFIHTELEKKYPELKGYIYGKYGTKFTNKAGTEMTIEMHEDQNDNLSMFISALNGKTRASKALLEQLETTVTLDSINVGKLPTECHDIDLNQFSVWIDPMDAGTQLITTRDFCYECPIKPTGFGLPCILVSIGLFFRESGKSAIGVINQPFATMKNFEWSGCAIWGCTYDEFNISALPGFRYYQDIHRAQVCVYAKEEEPKIKLKIIKKYFPFTPYGNSYRLLNVILKLAEGFILSHDTSYYWDVCAAHAILKSLGGNIWYFDKLNNLREYEEIVYSEKTSDENVNEYSHKGGIIATRTIYEADYILSTIKADTPQSSDSDSEEDSSSHLVVDNGFTFVDYGLDD